MNVSMSAKPQAANPSTNGLNFDNSFNAKGSLSCVSVFDGNIYDLGCDIVYDKSLDEMAAGFSIGEDELKFSDQEAEMDYLDDELKQPLSADDNRQLPLPLTDVEKVEVVDSMCAHKVSQKLLHHTVDNNAVVAVDRSALVDANSFNELGTKSAHSTKEGSIASKESSHLVVTNEETYKSIGSEEKKVFERRPSIEIAANVKMTSTGMSVANKSGGTLTLSVAEEYSAQFRAGSCVSYSLRGTLSAAISGSAAAGLALVVFALTDGCSSPEANKQLCQLQTDPKTTRRSLKLDLDLLLRYHSARGAALAPMLRYTNAETFKASSIVRANCTAKVSGSKILLAITVQAHPSLRRQEGANDVLSGLVVRASLAPLERVAAVVKSRFRPEQSGELTGEGVARVLLWSNVQNIFSGDSKEPLSVRLEVMLEMASGVQLPAVSSLPLAVTARLQGRLLSGMTPLVQLPRGSTVILKSPELTTQLDLRFL